jgi:hypothetical protein
MMFKQSFCKINIKLDFLICAFLAGSFVISYGQTHYPWLEARYSQDYIHQNRGKILVEIPEVYELANIIIAVAEYERDEIPEYENKGYYSRIIEHFLPYREHPLFSKTDFMGQRRWLFRCFRDNSACYVFKDDSIISKGIYPYIKFFNYFHNQLELVEDFAKESGFRNFYRQNLPYYRSLIQEYLKKVPVINIWQWLESRFPERYDCYKIIFSPLISGYHTTQRFKNGNFQEILMFVSGPKVYKEYRGRVEEGLLSRVVFTEIGHNYINPVTDKITERMKDVFSDVEKWNRQGGYDSPYATFNEYMTWAVFILYAYDSYKEEVFQKLKHLITTQMVESRKFVLFGPFSEKILDFYKDSQPGVSIPDLFPKILNWASMY